MKKWQNHLSTLIGVCVVSLFACTASIAADRTVNPNDPYEPFNRVMYNFNDLLDRVILKPAAKLYNKVMPIPLRKGISNIFSNLDNIPTVANDVLQTNFYQAVSDSWRFAINSTIGIAGFFDVAEDLGLERNSEDLGLTLAQWGWKSSNYLVLPFIGPSSVRDALAWPVNYEILTIYPYIHPIRNRYILYGFGVVSKRAELLRFQNVMEQASLDRYVFMRDAYLQNRNYRIERNKQLGDPYLNKSTLEKAADDTPGTAIENPDNQS
jgi:phospholipid-binding lipoprotein MlaA